MNKLTKEEKKELRSLMEFIAFAEGSGGDTEADYDELEIWVEQKKKQWQEEAGKTITIKWIVSRLSKKTLTSMDRYKPGKIIFEEASEFTKEEMDFLLKRYGLDRP